MDADLLSRLVFCAKFLKKNGYDSSKIKQLEPLFKKFSKEYELVEIKKDFYTELAEKMRVLWPPGEKDGKFPWRDSVSNLAARLRAIFIERKLDGYSIDDCLAVARKYLAQYEDNAKYMKTLKYFIFKQNRIVQPDGAIKYECNSTFADMLEGQKYVSTEEEWESMFTESSTYEGELV